METAHRQTTQPFFLVCLLAFTALTLTHSYLFFHCAVELFSIVIAAGIFFVAWHGRHFHKNPVFLFIGVAYASVAFLDFCHTLTYHGMGIFLRAHSGVSPGADPAIEFWIAGRYVEALALLIAPQLHQRDVRPRPLLLGTSLLTAVLFAAIYAWGIFPPCFLADTGLTAFKIVSEYIIAGVLFLAMLLLWKRRSDYAPVVLRHLLLAMLFTVVAEMAFTLYTDMYGIFNIVGHFAKLLSFACIYKATITTALEEPYALLFRELKASEESLRKARDSAEAGMRARAAFLAAMSHEIRTPINGVLGMADLLLTTRLAARQRHFAERLRASGQTLHHLINQILDFSRLESGQVTLERITFDLYATVEEAVGLLAAEAHRKGLEFTSHIPPSVPRWLQGDPTRMQQILLNLLGNAMKFTETGEVSLEVALPPDNRGEAQTLQIHVRDTGIGIPRDALESIFEAFVQAGDDTYRRYGGTGLGLTISNRIAEALGASLTAQSTVGAGSCFTLALPLAPGTPPHSWQPPQLPAGVGPLLYVDDHSASRQAFAMLAARLGGTVRTSTGTDLPPDWPSPTEGPLQPILFLDQKTAARHGPTLFHRLERGRPAIVLVTHLTDAEETQGIAPDGREGPLLTKPVREADLLRTATTLVGAPDPAEPTLITPRTHGERALVAEDNAASRIILEHLLTDLGYDVYTSPDGDTALDLLQQADYDVAFIDCNLPARSGFEVVQAAQRQGGPSAGALFIAITAQNDPEVIQQARAAGMADCLIKPLTPQRVRETLTRHRRRGDAPGPAGASDAGTS